MNKEQTLLQARDIALKFLPSYKTKVVIAEEVEVVVIIEALVGVVVFIKVK